MRLQVDFLHHRTGSRIQHQHDGIGDIAGFEVLVLLHAGLEIEFVVEARVDHAGIDDADTHAARRALLLQRLREANGLEQALRQALKIEPANATTNYNLGLNGDVNGKSVNVGGSRMIKK